MNTLYTYGYQMGATLEVFAQALERQNMGVMDVRMSAGSRNPEWSGKRLLARLGDRYLHMPALGNRNYKTGGPIKLADPVNGLPLLHTVMQTVPTVILCACWQTATCHRAVIAAQMVERYGCEVVHLTRADVEAWAGVGGNVQLGLFDGGAG